MIKYSSLTEKQKEVIDTVMKLEKQYGVGEIFIRFVNDFYGYQYIVHKKGATKFEVLLSQKAKVHGRVLNSLKEKGLIAFVDKNHNVIIGDYQDSIGGKVRIGVVDFDVPDVKTLLDKTDNVIKYLRTKITGNYTNMNDLLGCFIDIRDDLISGDLEHLNYKLFLYFRDMYLFCGNITKDNDVYVSKVDLKAGGVEFYLDKALDYVLKEY